MRTRHLSLVLLLALLAACGDDRPPVAIPHDPVCDNLTDVHCALPWPSDRWLAEDATRETGLRLAYDGAAFPTSSLGSQIDPAPYNRMDGYSPSSQLVTAFPVPADLTGIGGPEGLGASLEPDFPTVVLDLETGERVAHWIENDARAEDPSETLLYIRPGTRLLPDRRYGVAVRGLRDASGALLPAPAGFAALRDGRRTDPPAFEGRRESYEELFDAFEGAGVAREELQMAWWFHTESFASAHDDMLAMRADALDRLGASGLGCTVTNVEMDFLGLARRITATMTTPFYLDAAAPPAELVRDADGMPVFQQHREVTFTAVVPNALYEPGAAPGRLTVLGHGLFGEAQGFVSSPALVQLAVDEGLVLVGTDWLGMSQSDLPFLGNALTDVSLFYQVGESLQQGMINQIALTRGMIGSCAIDAAFTGADGSAVGTATPWFIGGSQGSILGGTLLTLSPDFERGALVVGGTGFSFMIERSIHFNTFQPLLSPSYPRRIDRGLLMALSQHAWDRGESAAWLRYTTEGVAGLPPRSFLYLVAENDAQVTNLASERAARLSGVPVLDQSTHIPFGTTTVSSPHEGSAYLAMDLGDREPPEGNLSPDVDDGGHGALGFTPEAITMIREFLGSGGVTVPCDGICDLTGP